MSRQIDRLLWHVEPSHEALALFGRFWLVSNPPLPDAASKAAQAVDSRRYRGFIDALSKRMEAGPKLRDELGAQVSAT